MNEANRLIGHSPGEARSALQGIPCIDRVDDQLGGRREVGGVDPLRVRRLAGPFRSHVGQPWVWEASDLGTARGGTTVCRSIGQAAGGGLR